MLSFSAVIGDNAVPPARTSPLAASGCPSFVMRRELLIREARRDEASSLAVLAAQVWLHTYATEGISSEIATFVLAEITPARFTESLQDPLRQVFVASHPGGLIGFAAVKREEPCAYSQRSTVELQTLYVQEHFIGQGIGALLLRSAERWAQSHAHAPLWLTVNTMNAQAIRFYQRHGYTKIGTDFFKVGSSRHENHVLIGADA